MMGELNYPRLEPRKEMAVTKLGPINHGSNCSVSNQSQISRFEQTKASRMYSENRDWVKSL